MTVAESTTRRDRSDAADLLSVRGLVKHFPIRKGLLQRQVGAVQAVDGLDFEVRRARRFAGRGVRLRQVHDRPAAHPAARADRGHDHASRAATSRHIARDRCGRCAATSR